MKRQIRLRAVIATSVALVAAGTVTAGVGIASPEHKTAERRPPAAAAKPTPKEIAGLFDAWNAALRTGDPETVAARYAPDAVLLPTASPKIRTNHGEIVDYFEHFLQKKPVGEKVRSVITVLDSNSAIDAGLYRFHVTDPATGAKKAIDARYTYEYEKRGGTWLIVNHHSSVLPAEG
ncbi:SgcJ/EcaC family oxidoreductase [Streptomyces coeruleoprunus]|uniref:SgcJ/EcaC family oxidoreductase n=1 Tax=Streptomyces coeruleoprunus TaxID=285563 RepID=A0ABV9X6Q5_9ACTN